MNRLQDLVAQCLHLQPPKRCASLPLALRLGDFDSGPVKQLPLLGELTPQSGSGACVSCFATVDFAFVPNRPIFRTGDNQVGHLSEKQIDHGPDL